MGADHRVTAKTVLVVDDDPIQTGQIAMFLQSQGIDVTTENNGYAAVNSIKRIRPAIVVMDVRMPGLDGIEAAKIIANLQPKPKSRSGRFRFPLSGLALRGA